MRIIFQTLLILSIGLGVLSFGSADSRSWIHTLSSQQQQQQQPNTFQSDFGFYQQQTHGLNTFNNNGQFGFLPSKQIIPLSNQFQPQQLHQQVPVQQQIFRSSQPIFQQKQFQPNHQIQMPLGQITIGQQQPQVSYGQMPVRQDIIVPSEPQSVCEPSPCLNEGKCVRSGDSSFSCVCPWGWSGARCEMCITECASNPCSSNKRCKAHLGGGFECVCPPDRTGLNCEIQNDLCSNNPCLNGGQCRAIEGGSFTCDCVQPWSGSNCQQTFQNPCTEEALRNPELLQFPNPWIRTGYLICTDVNVYQSMQCAIGTYFNEKINHCVPEGFDPPACPANFCQNDAECLIDATNQPRCACRKGFNGDRCETNVDECAVAGGAAACAGGQCVDQINGYICRCAGDTLGLNCRETMANPCTEANLQTDNIYHAVPSAAFNVFLQCTGPLAFTVSRCADQLFWHDVEQTCSTERAPLRAANGLCARQQPCKNGAECVDGQAVDSYTCTCRTGYTGLNCETMIDYCQSSPCQNSGRCLSYAGGYTCVCQDKVIDECCCHGIVNPCPPRSKVLPGINNYFPHLFAHRYVHCDFDGRAFVKTCAPSTRWNQDTLTCLPENFVINGTALLGIPAQPQYGQAAPQQAPSQYGQAAPAQSAYAEPAPTLKAPPAPIQPAYSAPAPALQAPPAQSAYAAPAPALQPPVAPVQSAYGAPASAPLPQPQAQSAYAAPAPASPEPQAPSSYSAPAPAPTPLETIVPQIAQNVQQSYAPVAPAQQAAPQQYGQAAPLQAPAAQPAYSAPAPASPVPQAPSSYNAPAPAPLETIVPQIAQNVQQSYAPVAPVQQAAPQQYGQAAPAVPVAPQQLQDSRSAISSQANIFSNPGQLSPQILMQLIQSGAKLPDSILSQISGLFSGNSNNNNHNNNNNARPLSYTNRYNSHRYF